MKMVEQGFEQFVGYPKSVIRTFEDQQMRQIR